MFPTACVTDGWRWSAHRHGAHINVKWAWSKWMCPSLRAGSTSRPTTIGPPPNLRGAPYILGRAMAVRQAPGMSTGARRGMSMSSLDPAQECAPTTTARASSVASVLTSRQARAHVGFARRRLHEPLDLRQASHIVPGESERHGRGGTARPASRGEGSAARAHLGLHPGGLLGRRLLRARQIVLERDGAPWATPVVRARPRGRGRARGGRARGGGGPRRRGARRRGGRARVAWRTPQVRRSGVTGATGRSCSAGRWGDRS